MVVDLPNSDMIEAAIKKYFADDSAEFRNKMIDNIREEKNRLSWSNFCNKLLSFYKEF